MKLGNKTCATYISWSDTQIKCRAPTKAKYGAVTAAAGASNAMGFTVKR